MARGAAPVRLLSGSWNIRWVDAKGQRRSATFATFNEARQELARRQVEAVAERRALGGRRAADEKSPRYAGWTAAVLDRGIAR
ncbi:MAG: hypothetical protein FJ100_22035 [Deltaproteobacteria bacterium]|nr:hypothetical protein [Deltaproteobacteria bacterium]